MFVQEFKFISLQILRIYDGPTNQVFISATSNWLVESGILNLNIKLSRVSA